MDALPGRELINDIVLRRETNQNCLYFCGFYNVRIYGQKVAEIVFVATKENIEDKECVIC